MGLTLIGVTLSYFAYNLTEEISRQSEAIRAFIVEASIKTQTIQESKQERDEEVQLISP